MLLRRLTTERAMLIILFALVFALAAQTPADTDTWWHLRSGEYTLTHGIIYNDPFSFTYQGQPWINHSWGSQLILYGMWKLAGNLGLVVYTAVLATAGMAFVYKMSAGSVYLRAFAVVLGAATAAIFWSARPQMMSFLFSAVVLYVLDLYRRQQVDRVWIIPPLMALWANLHAGHSIGFILLVGVVAGETLGNLFQPLRENVVTWARINKLALVGLVSAVVLLINPYGVQVILVQFQTVGIDVLQRFIQEWNSPNFHSRQTWPFVALLFGTAGAWGVSRKKLNWTDFVLFAGTGFMALVAARHIATFAIVATPLLTRYLNDALEARDWVIRPAKVTTPGIAWLNVALVVVVSFGAAVKLLATADQEGVRRKQATRMPVDAVVYLNRSGLDGPIFNSYNWGGYLMFAAPEYPVFVDGRTDMYGQDFLQRYLLTATGATGWRDVLDEYGVNIALVEVTSGLASHLRESSEWRLEYEDALAVVFVLERH